MSAYEPWRYQMPECGSHGWTYRHTFEEYVCQVCGNHSHVIYDKKIEKNVRRPGDRTEPPHNETNA